MFIVKFFPPSKVISIPFGFQVHFDKFLGFPFTAYVGECTLTGETMRLLTVLYMVPYHQKNKNITYVIPRVSCVRVLAS